jgi:hypothetical protein
MDFEIILGFLGLWGAIQRTESGGWIGNFIDAMPDVFNDLEKSQRFMDFSNCFVLETRRSI